MHLPNNFINPFDNLIFI